MSLPDGARTRGPGEPRLPRRLARKPRTLRTPGKPSKPGKSRKPRTLRTRLVVSAVALIAVVCAVIGTVTTLTLRSHLYDQLDGSLAQVSARASGPPIGTALPGGHPGDGRDDRTRDDRTPDGRTPENQRPERRDPLKFVTVGPQELGTIGAVVNSDGTVRTGVISTEADSSTDPGAASDQLDADQLAALAAVPRDGEPHNVDVPELGEYRVEYAGGTNGDYLVGLPTTKVGNTLSTLVVTEVSVTAAGLVAASLAGAAMVGVALRPLRRVAATATRVSELPLHSGEVALHERVPDAEADARTEVGQVGAALNRMLDHVHSALHARQRSETRVRRFVADASHELRTPLASIRGYAELTRRGREETGPDTRHALGRIESEATRMTGLVEDLLLLARLDADRLDTARGDTDRADRAGRADLNDSAARPLSYEPTDLVPLVVDVLSDARAAGPDHIWRLDLPPEAEPVPEAGPEAGPESEAEPEVEPEPMLVLADPARVHQVLVNLLANARTHTPPGTTVTARLRHEGPRVCLDVADDGPGIPPDLLPHVFERFARGDSSRSRAHGSTGLGLAIVQAVVAAHDGSVTVTSEPGGTVFTVRLPAYAEDGTPPAQANSTPPAHANSALPSYANSTPPPYSQTGHSLSTQP